MKTFIKVFWQIFAPIKRLQDIDDNYNKTYFNLSIEGKISYCYKLINNIKYEMQKECGTKEIKQNIMLLKAAKILIEALKGN